jgi:hypothetical protein
MSDDPIDMSRIYRDAAQQRAFEHQHPPNREHELESVIARFLGRLRITGDQHIGVRGSFPHINLYYKDSTTLPQLPGGSGGASAPLGPFAKKTLTSTGQLTLTPGTVNGLVPSNPFDPIDCSGSTVTHVKLHCTTSSYQVNGAAWMANGTPATPPPAIKGAPPSTFDVTIGLVLKVSSTIYQYFPVWPIGFDVVATPIQWILTDRDMPEPGQSSHDIWYSWRCDANYFTG